MATLQSTRQSNHSKRALPAHARPSKPAPLFKRTNSQGGSKKVAHRRTASVEDEDEEGGMATSFLNFCTTCEKQIVVPSNSILYCSESCRRKDNEKQLSIYPNEHSPPPTPFYNFSFEDLHFRDIVPPRSPTATRSQRSSCAFSLPETPLDETAHSGDERVRTDSEASRYLRQFQTQASAASKSNHSHSSETVRPVHVRPRYARASTSSASTFGTGSSATTTLSNYPYSSASASHTGSGTYTHSSSTAPSLTHTPASSYSQSHPYPYTPFTPSSRPLPPRTNPYSSSHSARNWSIDGGRSGSRDLVTPFGYATAPSTPPSQYSYSMKAGPLSTQTSKGCAEGEILYAKSPVPRVGEAGAMASGSLRELFAGTGTKGWA